ncbi:FAD-dependent oxidoreductase [Enterococcus alcedinis]|uniref:CoA-disulfide reductase n=1 Tax=Enterococcus alcedinis TaxID=1274384 RepID=A0A917JGH7_9ENTE|nr:FAD-dependent oxidoreductase [Enterococcus alcedinis]MBP2101822.1 NADPH-dependent 2,4-dienoyl-CoA reductase/sulfur reductase-like enzyme/rhodanese-related sulfurtransferase [Enterococcus alcedinis]GGI65385.1 CoA-disulfide reductase [Enterococcus alcedinis]
MKVIIVGGVAGGMSAATRLRRLNEEAQIIIFEKGPYVSFANCGLPYYVSGEITDKSQLLVQTPESLQARFNLDVRPNHEVVGIDAVNKTVTVAHDGQYSTESYDHLILSPGAKPFVPPIDGLTEATNAFSLRNVPDLEKIMAVVEKQAPKNAVVIGAGFIGLEMAETLHARGLNVTIVEKAPHVLPPLDEEMAAFITKELTANGVTVRTSQSAVAFKENGKRILLEDGSELASDLTILSVGVTPENSLAKAAGIELGLRGGILVDERYETSVKDIYAVGDAIVVKNQVSGEDALISLASPANRQGRQVADILSGMKRTNKGSIGTAIVRTFNMTAASTGLSERAVRLLDKPFAVVHTSGKDHAGYYPGATDIHMKLIFNPETGEIYGAQGVGQKGVDKRIDILATAIKGNLTVEDLPELEFTYAPPFGSAKDPVNMLGYVALNVMEGLTDMIQWHEVTDATQSGKVILDVRNDSERQQGQFKNSVNIPLNDLRTRLHELDKDTEYIITCHSGLRSYVAERILKQADFKVENLDGAFSLYHTVLPEELDYV